MTSSKQFGNARNEVFLQEGLASYCLMMEGRRDLVDRVWYNADRALSQDALKGTTKYQHLVDENVNYSLLRTMSALPLRLYRQNTRLRCNLPSRSFDHLVPSQLSKISGDPTSRS